VEVAVEGPVVRVKGPKGQLERSFKGVLVAVEGGKVTLTPTDESRDGSALWGLGRALLNNMVVGVAQGFERELEIQGVGYRAELQGTTLVLSLGFSHPINFPLPKGITAEVSKKQTEVVVRGIDKELLGQTVAKIRGFKPPEPYKGKGIRYKGERIQRKVGKKAA
jgi:large subunit ribosomal protein L6